MGDRTPWVRAAVLVAVLLGVVFLEVRNDPPAPASAPCAAGTSPQTTSAWDGVLRLEQLGRTEDATRIAVRVLARTGSLPSDPDECDLVRDLLAPSRPGVLSRTASSLGTGVTTWWWALAVGLAAAAGGLGWLVRRSWWRVTMPWPRLVLGVGEADDKATGVPVGARLSAVVRSQLLQLSSGPSPSHVMFLSPEDASVPGLPLDELPDRVTWLLAMLRWLDQRNRLTLTLTVLQGRGSRVSVISSISEPTGATTHDRTGMPRRALIERSGTGSTPAPEDYLRLTGPVTAWAVFQMSEVARHERDLPALLGTGSWRAYAHFLDGTAALEASDVAAARDHFDRARSWDDSSGFLELRLNSAYADARTDDVVLWKRALDEFRALSKVPGP